MRCRARGDLGAASFSRRRRLPAAARLAASLTLRSAVVVFAAAHPRCRGLETVPNALGLRLRRFLLSRLLLGRARVELAANELDLRDFGPVATAAADLQDARIATGPFGEARRNRIE